MRTTPKIIITVAILLSGSWILYAACVPNATPGAFTSDYTAACNCQAATKYTTDAAGESEASLATCKTCPASTGGCNSTSENYPDVYEWSCPAGKVSSGNCDPMTRPTCTGGTHHSNAAKYQYVSTGCSS